MQARSACRMQPAARHVRHVEVASMHHHSSSTPGSSRRQQAAPAGVPDAAACGALLLPRGCKQGTRRQSQLPTRPRTLDEAAVDPRVIDAGVRVEDRHVAHPHVGGVGDLQPAGAARAGCPSAPAPGKCAGLAARWPVRAALLNVVNPLLWSPSTIPLPVAYLDGVVPLVGVVGPNHGVPACVGEGARGRGHRAAAAAGDAGQQANTVAPRRTHRSSTGSRKRAVA